MRDDPVATRRTVLQAAGVTVGTAAFGSAAYAANQSFTKTSASVDWYTTRTGSNELSSSPEVFAINGGYTVLGGGTITRLSADGQEQWTNELPDTYWDIAHASDEGYIGVRTENKAETAGEWGIITKVDGDGNELWTWEYDGEESRDNRLSHIASGKNGGAYAFGYYYPGSDQGKVPLVVQVGKDGEPNFKKQYDKSKYEWLIKAAAIRASNTDSRDHGAVAYRYGNVAKIRGDGSVGWSRTYDGWHIHELEGVGAGGYVGVGVNPDGQLALLWLDDQGDRQQTATFSLPDGASVDELHFAHADTGYVVGDPNGGNTWVMGLTENGDQRWLVTPGEDGNTVGLSSIASVGDRYGITGDWDDPDTEESRGTFIAQVTEGSGSGQTPTDTATPTDTTTETETGTGTAGDGDSGSDDSDTATATATGTSDGSGDDCEI